MPVRDDEIGLRSKYRRKKDVPPFHVGSVVTRYGRAPEDYFVVTKIKYLSRRDPNWSGWAATVRRQGEESECGEYWAWSLTPLYDKNHWDFEI